MSQGAGDSQATDDASTDDRPTEESDAAELQADVRAAVAALFGENVEFTVEEYTDHVDVRVLPNGAVEDVESAHDVRIVPYNALRMTIRKDE